LLLPCGRLFVQELVALGACNVLGSFFSSYPVSGSFSRTAVNVEAGARTPLANAVRTHTHAAEYMA
jgi:MFS superfamily sulfate permease-like transporter